MTGFFLCRLGHDMSRRARKSRSRYAGWLVAFALLLAGAWQFWPRSGGVTPVWVLGAEPGRGFTVVLTGLPRGVEHTLHLGLPGGGTQAIAAENDKQAAPGTARFALPWRLAGQTVQASLAGGDRPVLNTTLHLPSADLARQTLYLGSCLSEPDGGAASGMLAALRADAQGKPAPAMLWLGDNLYFRSGEWYSEQGMIEAYAAARRNPALAGLLQSMPNYAIWDDHDFGPNDADRSFPQRTAAQRVFRSHWANPPPATHDGGLYTSIRRGEVELFLTDGRSYRDPRGAPGRAMLGTAQIAWLQAGLQRSTAPVKLIAGGSQWLSDHPSEEGWQQAPRERRAFLDWLVSQQIPGVLFLSGDRHHTVLLEREHLGRSLYELTCSALSSAPDPVGARGYEGVRRLEQTAQNNFCRLDIGTDGTITVTALNARGKVLFSRALVLR